MTTPPVIRDLPVAPGPNRPTTLESDTQTFLTDLTDQFVPDMQDTVDWIATQTTTLASGFLLPEMITYTFDSTTTASDPGDGKIRIGSGSTAIYADNLDSFGTSATGRLSKITGSNTVKAFVLVYKVGDPTARFAADCTLATANSGYYTLTIQSAVTTGDALANGDDVILSIQVKGDKGDTGATGPSTVWTANGSPYTPSGSPSVITFALGTSNYSHRFRFVNLDLASSQFITITYSNGGATFGGSGLLTSSTQSRYNGFLTIEGTNRDVAQVAKEFTSTSNPGSPDNLTTTETNEIAIVTGGITHVRLTATSTTFASGTIVPEMK